MKACSPMLSEYFKEARVRAGLTQEEVAVVLGYSTAQFISNWERGKAGVPLAAVKRLIRLYSLEGQEVIEEILKKERELIVGSLRDSC